MYPLVETITPTRAARRESAPDPERAKEDHADRHSLKSFARASTTAARCSRRLPPHLETRARERREGSLCLLGARLLVQPAGDDPIGLYFKGGTSLSKAYGLIRRFSEDIDIGIYKADLHVPLEADIAALPSVNQQQRALAENVDEAARQYISGPLKELLAEEIAAVEDAAEQRGHFSLGFGFDPYRNRDALDILVRRLQERLRGRRRAMSRPQCASKAARVLIRCRPNRARSCPTSPLKCRKGETLRFGTLRR